MLQPGEVGIQAGRTSSPCSTVAGCGRSMNSMTTPRTSSSTTLRRSACRSGRRSSRSVTRSDQRL
eukprot:6916124-Lingulodinium_polyedra.AAC.1